MNTINIMDLRGETDFQKLAEQFCSRNERPPKLSTRCSTKPSTTRKCEMVVNLNQTKDVPEPNLWPYSAHGYLKFRNGSGQNILGSGTLIGPNVVLTAAHNLYDRRAHQNYTDIRFYSSSSRGYVENRSVRAYFPESYRERESEDYGIVILAENVGAETGYYGISFLNDSDVAYKRIHLAGFPSEHNGNVMRTCTKNVASSTSDKITYMFDSLGGESGSCIWYTEGETCLIAGVHVLTSTTHNSESAVSTATFINEERYENIRNWVIGHCRNSGQTEERKAPAPAPVERNQLIVCNKGHQLAVERSINNRCNCCREQIVNTFMRCKPCDFDMCMSCEQCITFSAPLAKFAKCANGHPLVWDPLRLGKFVAERNSSFATCTINCDVCGVKTMSGSFACSACSYDICTKCIPKKIQR